jgi:surface protein
MNIDTMYQVESIDISNWNLGSNINTLQQLFCNLDSLTEIIGFDTIDFSNIVSIESLFQGTGLTEFNYTNIPFPKLKRAYNLFAYSNDLEYINISNWEVPQLNYCVKMFAQCPKLKTVEGLNTWNNTSILECRDMFFNCTNLQHIRLNGFDVSNVKTFEGMFDGCISLKSINISDWSLNKVNVIERMFKGCINLETIGIFPYPTDNKKCLSNCSEMFYDCNKLKLDLSHITAQYRINKNFSKGTDPKLFKRPKFKV